uniref:Uncharacterized protein n=1 Tax=Solanum lycopersicum TaxID=4081 RepID=A0A3Q7EY69_SOLLC
MECTIFEVKVKKTVVFVNKTSSSLKNEFLIHGYAGRKKAIPYGGDMAVSNIIDFLAHHGSHFYDFPQEKGLV